MLNSNSITIPPIERLSESAAALAQAAQDAGDTANAHALNKAIWYLQQGITLMPTTGGFLIASATRAGTIHRLSNQFGCSCEAGIRSKPCWHMGGLEIIEAAQQCAVPLDLRLTDARVAILERQAAAEAALLECYA